MSAGSSISGIGGLFYLVMLIVGICSAKGKYLKNERIYYTVILIISFILFMTLLLVLFNYSMVNMHW